MGSPLGPQSRVVIVGTSGAGKSTLARALAKRLGVADIELDALHWEPQWTQAAHLIVHRFTHPRQAEEFLARTPPYASH